MFLNGCLNGPHWPVWLSKRLLLRYSPPFLSNLSPFLVVSYRSFQRDRCRAPFVLTGFGSASPENPEIRVMGASWFWATNSAGDPAREPLIQMVEAVLSAIPAQFLELPAAWLLCSLCITHTSVCSGRLWHRI